MFSLSLGSEIESREETREASLPESIGKARVEGGQVRRNPGLPPHENDCTRERVPRTLIYHFYGFQMKKSFLPLEEVRRNTRRPLRPLPMHT
jgi:hypothetical protein